MNDGVDNVYSRTTWWKWYPKAVYRHNSFQWVPMGHVKNWVLKGILSAKPCMLVATKMSPERHGLGTDFNSYAPHQFHRQSQKYKLC